MRALVLLLLVGCGRFGFEPGSVDGTTSGDGADGDAALPFCEVNAQVMFCSDLSTMSPWLDGNQLNGQYEILDGTLHATTNPVGAGASANAFMIYSLAASAVRIMESADVRIDTAGTGDPILMQVRMTQGQMIHTVEYVYRSPPSTAYIEESRDPGGAGMVLYDSYLIPGPAFPAGEWHRIQVVMDVSGAPHAIVHLDGVMVLDQPLAGALSGAARIEIGIVFVKGPANSWDMRFDNVLAEAQ